MQNALLVGLSRQVAMRRQLDVIANNIANQNTNGYKADGLIYEEFAVPRPGNEKFLAADRRVSFVSDRATWIDLRGGPVQQTGNPLDVAIDGGGFLAVQTPRGERYTRNGGLQINAAGQLVTAEGYAVLGEAGPITLQPQDRDVSIAKDGTLTVAQGQRGRIRLVEFAQPGRLQKDGASTFMAPAGQAPQPATQSTLLQGAIEKSNVQGVVEVTRMIEATRTYTTIAQMTEQQNTLRKTAIERLADVPN
ncbi:MAG: flagellar basal-body rod protein FlgF [Variibacter sp.]|nr:flagellar basal-body rod protein FlgF [Variibacter sp.]